MKNRKLSLKKEEASLNKKIEEDANAFREKYPDIAKMTVSEVVSLSLFAEKLKAYLPFYRAVDFYAFNSLRLSKQFEPDTFRQLYLDALDNKSTLPYPKKFIVISIGNEVYQRTVNQLKRDLKKSQE